MSEVNAKLSKGIDDFVTTVRNGTYDAKIISDSLETAATLFVFPVEFVDLANKTFKEKTETETLSVRLDGRYVQQRCFEDGLCVYAGRLVFTDFAGPQEKVVEYSFETDASQDQ